MYKFSLRLSLIHSPKSTSVCGGCFCCCLLAVAARRNLTYGVSGPRHCNGMSAAVVYDTCTTKSCVSPLRHRHAPTTHTHRHRRV